MNRIARWSLAFACCCWWSLSSFAQPVARTGPGDAAVAAYFRAETAAIANASLADVRTAADWDAKRGEYRRQLAEMLGLDPMPERTDLKAVTTGKIEHELFTVEKVHFQSRPGLYVTGNLWLPKNLTKPAPAILYVCGHGNVKKDGVSYGAKTFYQHWGGYLARAGYVALLIDTIELGEFECTHHGTNSQGMWWWLDRGYTPAGPEAWNAIRALDYLETRPEVDKTKLGVTGRSGGGAYSWWLAALDDRVKVAVPTAGITDLQNHVVDGAIEGHCDCMYMVNTYRWDFGQVMALVAPRPLLVQNSDKDWIFPLDGVQRLYAKTNLIYDLASPDPKKKTLGLNITEGPHKDTQDLQVPALRWFNRHFKGDEAPVEIVAKKYFEPAELKVFKELPADNRNGNIHEWFVPKAPAPAVPKDKAEWERMRDGWMKALAEKSFRGWPPEPGAAEIMGMLPPQTEAGVTLLACEFASEHDVRLQLFLLCQENLKSAERVVLNVLDEVARDKWLAELRGGFGKVDDRTPESAAKFEPTRKLLLANKWVIAYLAPRGVGPTSFTTDERKRTHILRRYNLLGQTLEGMQVWDVRRAIQFLRSRPEIAKAPLWLRGERSAAGVALYASLFEPDVARLDLHGLTKSHVDGPHFLNVLKTLDIPAAVAMAAERSRVVVYSKAPTDWEYPVSVSKALGWPDNRIQIRAEPAE